MQLLPDGKAGMSPQPLKPKLCKACGHDFQPMRRLQAVCSPICAQAVAEAKRFQTEQGAAKLERAGIRKAKLALKTRRQWIEEAQREFNRYIRLRDAGKPCICCGRFSMGATRGGDFDAGHYRSRGAAPHLRFDERNVHAQLKHCNRYAFDIAAYRGGLVGRLGEMAVATLEADQRSRKWEIGDLKLIRDTYRIKARALKTQQEKRLAA